MLSPIAANRILSQHGLQSTEAELHAQGMCFYPPQQRFRVDPSTGIPQFRLLTPTELVPNTVAGISFETVTIDTPIYLNYLMSRFLAGGGSVIRGSIQHINQVIEGGTRLFSGGKPPSRPDAVVVCAGLGARTLGGVEDKSVYPLRGQTILLRAPWIKFGKTISSTDGLWTYTIPRRSGDVSSIRARSPEL